MNLEENFSLARLTTLRAGSVGTDIDPLLSRSELFRYRRFAEAML